jgi:multiple sugar transport system permease protein/raffinose/stachyose/melibiose transport system permease protein
VDKAASTEPASLGLLARDDRRKPVVARGRRRLKDAPVAWILLAPVLILFGIAVVFPLFDTLRLSFFDIKGLAQPKYVGFGNYVKLFVDPAFRRTLVTTLTFTLGTTVIAVGVGWVVAMLCAFAPRQTLPFRVMIFSAFGVSEAVTGYMWITMLRPDSGGLVNSVIRLFGFPDFVQPWLGDPNTALWALIVAASWGAAGLPLMLCFASVQAIPRSILEAAYMDGARPTSIMRHIMATAAPRSGSRRSSLLARCALDIIYVLTGGGGSPLRQSAISCTGSMTQFKLGYGAAATVILLVAVLIVSIPAIIQRTAGRNDRSPPRWVVLSSPPSLVWIIPIIGVIVTSVRPQEDVILGC